ncbi:hypothetical protein V2647_02070 [Tenacibaculum maritimum]|uniref:hypothetical protein n=1 Tax=Tenacibaculum maritimum TaxID=107401 RepID=UPI00387695C9
MTAKIHGVNGKTYNIAINFTIKEQEYFTLKIKTIEVTGVASAIWNQFSYNSVGGNTLISLNARFTIRALINNAMQITYQSNFNDANDVTYYNTFHNISSDLNTPYEAKVYKEGNHHPNGGTDNFKLNFYGQKTVTKEPIERLAFGHISFNEYRYLKPSEIIYTIGQTNYAITFKLILEWSN